MESKREQFEILSRELLGRLNDVNRQSELVFPFDYILDKEIEEKYFPKGAVLRGIIIKNMIIIDNSFRKFKLFPTHDIMTTYVETQKELLMGWKEESIKSFMKTYSDSKPEELDEFKKVLSKIEKDINKASIPALKDACSSEEAKLLNSEFADKSHGGFSEFVHNAILNLFKS